MVPHDQQLEVASPNKIADDLDSAFAILVCHTKLRADVSPALTIQPDFSAALFSGEGRFSFLRAYPLTIANAATSEQTVAARIPPAIELVTMAAVKPITIMCPYTMISLLVTVTPRRALLCHTSTGLSYAEKELPQPQDFVEFGFTNTKPCCIRVS